MANISHFTQTVNGVSTTYDIHDANAIPRSGGAVITGWLGKTTDTSNFIICGATRDNKGATMWLYGNNSPSYAGGVRIKLTDSNAGEHWFTLYPNGFAGWDGKEIATTSDQRLKQQISEIDDKLLDAWEDVELAQFKYNKSVDTKGKSARLHTGYVVQQIDKACQEHGVDISAYGLYCHEEYPQETEEVEVEQADGTKTKETKVIREASEHYSLRYTEVYAVECMYLRRCIARLTARIEELEKENKEAEK